METRRLGKTGIQVSLMGLGTVQFGLDYGFTKAKSQFEIDDLLNAAWESGINFIDTAPAYGNSEEKIGISLKSSNLPFHIATKTEKISCDELNDYDKLRDKLLFGVQDSCKRLGRIQIDLLQLHQADSFLRNSEPFRKVLLDLKHGGYVRALGISVYEPEELISWLISAPDVVDVVQIPYNLLDRRFDEVTATILSENIGVIARSVHLKGVLSCSEENLPQELHELVPYRRTITGILKSHNIEAGEAALPFVMSRPFIHTAIVGVNSVDEMKLNIQSLGKMNLLKNMDELNRIVQPERHLIDPRCWKSL